MHQKCNEYAHYYISIHAPREGGDAAETIMQQQNSISIHAPREGGDQHKTHRKYNEYISIHAPREGGDG